MSARRKLDSLDSSYNEGEDEIISDGESSDQQQRPDRRHSKPHNQRNLLAEPNGNSNSNHSDISSGVSSGGGLSPDCSPLRTSLHYQVDDLEQDYPKPLSSNYIRRSNQDLMAGETVRKESMHLIDPLQLSDDDDFSQEDSFADARSNEIITDDEMSISDDDYDDDDDDDDDDDFDEGDSRYSGEYSGDEDFEYHDMTYHSDSDDEITVEDALATIIEGEEEEEDESDEEDEDYDKPGAIQSLYSYSIGDDGENGGSNHSDATFVGALGGDPKSPLKRSRPHLGKWDSEDEDLNDSGYFMSKEPLYESRSIDDEEDAISTLLRTENWNALKPFLNKLRISEDEHIRDELTKMDTFGKTKMYPIHFIVWRAPNSFIKDFIGSIPYMNQSETLGRLDSFGNSPLHLACSRLEVETGKDAIDVSVVEMISECGPETHELLNKEGESPLALLMKSQALEADPVMLPASEATAEKLVRSILEGRIHLITRKNMFDYKTLLHTAASCGVHEKVLIALLELADPSIAAMEDTSKRIPLHYVASCASGKQPQVDIAEKLIEANKEGLVCSTASGDTPLHVFVSSIHQRLKEKEDCESPNATKMAEILRGSEEYENRCPILIKNSNGFSPLHCCALFNTPTNILEELMKSPFAAKAATITDSNSATPLHLACASSKLRRMLENIKFLGTPEAAVLRDNKSRTPMHVAAENPKMTKNFIKALIDINPKAAKIRNSKGRMPLHIALRKKAKDTIIKALLKAYPKAVKTTFSGRNSVFHEICQYDPSATIMKAMLKMHPAGCKTKNKSGDLPLHVAISHECSVDIMRELLETHPNACTTKNKSGNTPLHHAANNKSMEVVELLLKMGPKVCIMANKKGEKPLDLARAVEGNDEVVRIIEEKTKVYRKERALAKAKKVESKDKRVRSKERRNSSRSKERMKRRSRSKSIHSDDDLSLPEVVADAIEVKPKKPTSMPKIGSRSSGHNQRRRASIGASEPAKEEKKPLRRMLRRRASLGSSKVDREPIKEEKRPFRRILGRVSIGSSKVDPAKEEEKPCVDDVIEVKPKKPSSLPKIRSRSSGHKQRIWGSIGSSSRTDPGEPAREEKKPLRRMLKSFSQNVKRVTAKKELNGAEIKAAMSMSDRPSELKEEKAKKNIIAQSDHTYDRNPSRSGISRSNSAEGRRLRNRKVIHDEVSFAEKLKASKASRVFNRSSSVDKDLNEAQSPNSRRGLFTKKRRGSVGSADDADDLGSTNTYEYGITTPSSLSPVTKRKSVSPLQRRKKRSGSKKRDSKVSPKVSTGSGSTSSPISGMSSSGGSVTPPPDKAQKSNSRRGLVSDGCGDGDLGSTSTHESRITLSSVSPVSKRKSLSPIPKRKIRLGSKKRDSKTSVGSGSTSSMSSPGGSVTTLPPSLPDAPDSQRSLDSGGGRSKIVRGTSGGSKRSNRSGKKTSPKQVSDPTQIDNTYRKVQGESSAGLVKEVTPSESALPAAAPKNFTGESDDDDLDNLLDDLLG